LGLPAYKCIRHRVPLQKFEASGNDISDEPKMLLEVKKGG